MYVVLDFETTGLDYKRDQVTEIGAIRLDDQLREVGSFHTFVKLMPGNVLSEYTDITQDMVDAGVTEIQGMSQLEQFIGRATVVAQWAPFDLAFLSRHGIEPHRFICTKSLTSQAEPEESSSLGPTCERHGISLVNAHRALDDARATGQVLAHWLTSGKELDSDNSLVVSPGRPLNFIPRSTKTIYTKKGEVIANFN
ncbi:3'-5' exonuclease [Rossellomorea marisflavi]|uniref:3'-5' exonuclease n=1 Tax=Rossellomorea marisflavi TaxID=189381 RepID=UPI0009A5BB0B|nr:3'-5' exonuclease [Rossellomorea marisflavi]